MRNLYKTSGFIALSAMLVTGAMLVSSPASAESIKEVCEAALTKEGGEDFTGCVCLQDLVKDNAELEAHLITLADKGPGIASRREAANDDGKKALDSCFPSSPTNWFRTRYPIVGPGSDGGWVREKTPHSVFWRGCH